MDNNPNLKCYPSLIKNDTLLNNTTLPLVINSNLYNKVFISKETTIGTSEKISNDSYHINKITLSARLNDIEIDNKNHAKSGMLIENPVQKMLPLSFLKHQTTIKRKLLNNSQIPKQAQM